MFHTYAMKAIILCKIAHPNIDQAIYFLSSIVTDTNKVNKNKLLRVMIFLRETINDVLTLKTNDITTVMWYIDIALQVNFDMKSHIEAVFTMVKVGIISSSTKQKRSLRSSIESELIGVDDKIFWVLLIKSFLE